MSDAKVDRLVTVSLMTVVFMGLVALAGRSMDFQQRCETACDGDRALTPVLNLQETCLCDDGHGRWRRELEGDGTIWGPYPEHVRKVHDDG